MGVSAHLAEVVEGVVAMLDLTLLVAPVVEEVGVVAMLDLTLLVAPVVEEVAVAPGSLAKEGLLSVVPS